MNNFPPLTTALMQQAHQRTVQRFGRTVKLYTPLYVSNECIDTCLYCGFRRDNKIRRATLTMENILAETDHLHAQGFQHILLVSGEHPKYVNPEYLCQITRQLKNKWSSVAIEVAPFPEANYRTLAEAGVDSVVLYQETYNRNVYQQVHQGGPKKDYDQRLEFVEGACRAGMRTVGIGMLLGLAPWQEELEALINHARALRKKYWKTEFTISLPRLQTSAAEFTPSHPVSDQEMAHMICLLRIYLPEVGLVLSTREPPTLRETLLPLGITQMSAGSRTEPGGYLHPNEAEEQFSIADHRTPAEVAAMITKLGYEPVWKENI